MKKLLLLTMLGLSIFACKESSDIEGVALQLSASEMLLRVEATEAILVAGPTEWVNSEIVWTSTNSGVATVDENGVVTGVKEGSSQIYAFVKNADAVRGICTVTVSNVEVSKIEAFLVKKGGDHTVVVDRRSEIMSKYDTLDIVYVATPANAYLKTTIMRSDSIGGAVLEIFEEVADKDTRGIWRAQVTGTGRIDDVKLTVVSADDDKMKSNVLEVDVKANAPYTATKGMTAYQKKVSNAPLATLSANHTDTLVIDGLPANGVFAPFVWRSSNSNFQVTPFSYKVKSGSVTETFWGAQISVDAAGISSTIYAENADGESLSWVITSAADTATNKKMKVSFGKDSLGMAINDAKMIPDFEITHNMAITTGSQLNLSFISRPAKNSAGINKKWWLSDGQTAIPTLQLPAAVNVSLKEVEAALQYVSAKLGSQGQGEALAIIKLTDKDGEISRDTMAFTVVDFVIENLVTGINVAQLYATYNSLNFGTEVEAKAKLFNYTNAAAISLAKAELFIKKGTEVAPKDTLKKNEPLEVINLSVSASSGSGVEGNFAVITPKYAREIDGYAIKFTFATGGITYTAVRDAEMDKGVPYAAPAR